MKFILLRISFSILVGWTQKRMIPLSSSVINLSDRFSIPIMSRQVAGNKFFYIRLKVGNALETNVILDTGSIGLRALTSNVLPIKKSNIYNSYYYESGVQLDGFVSKENVTLGGYQLGHIPV